MKRKKLTIALVASTVAALMLVATLSVYAYFTTRVYVYTDAGKEIAHVGMNLQLLFGKLEEYNATSNPQGVKPDTNLGIPSYNAVTSAGADVVDEDGVWSSVAGNGQYLNFNDGSEANPTPYNPDAPWGSAQNPYVISETRHLQNLSALQSVGYFDMLYIGDNFADGEYQEGSASIPYFVICNTDGTPVTIDGSGLEDPIKPIGSAEHPFIGVIGGAFVNTKTETNDNTTTTVQLTTNVAGKTSSVSTVHGFKIQTNTNQTDVGLFGYVGYLGTEPAEATSSSTFPGVVSVLQNLLLSDVQVTVKNPTLPEIVSELLGHVFNNHRFTYTGTKDDSGNPITTPTVPPHENHHIGIVAGHVSYAHAEYISVYYSDDDKCAIDLLHTNTAKMNYHSSTGIVGFMHNMNATVTNHATDTTPGHCLISYGGISSSGVNITPDTPGAGGGKEIGLGRGYVVAKTLYEGCHYIQANQGLVDRIWKYTVGGNVYYGPMFYATTSNGTTTYKSQNNTDVTIADGVATDAGTGKSYSVYAIRTAGGTDSYTYTLYNGATGVGSFTPNTTTNVELPMSVWEYVLTKPLDEDGNPIEDQGQWTWVSAVLLEQKTDGSYILTDTLYKNNYPVTVNGTTATINGATYADGTAVTIQKVFFKRSDGTYSTTATGDAVTPEFFREKSLLIADAKTMLGTDLCITSEYSTGKYFYDGVFTFALSNPLDTIESTWENETPDQVTIGPNVDNQWKDAPYDGYYGVVAYIRPLLEEDFKEIAQNNATLIAQGDEPTPIFVGYHSDYSDKGEGVPDWTEETLRLMKLEEGPTDAGAILSNNFYSTTSNTKSFFSEDDRQEVIQLMGDIVGGDDDVSMTVSYNPNNLSISQLRQEVLEQNVQLLDLESATNVQTLMNDYLITPVAVDNGYTFSKKGTNIYLSILKKDAILDYYSIWAGSAPPPPSSGAFGVTQNFYWNTTANVSYQSGAFNVSYTYDSRTYWVQYSSENDDFRGNTSSSNLFFYTIEAMMTVKSGQLVYVPTEDVAANQQFTFNADEYVLWPNAILKNDGTYNGTYNGFDEIQKGVVSADRINTTNATATKTDGGVYDTYKLLSLAELYQQDSGWQDGYGHGLSNLNLRKKFAMQEAVDFSLSLNIPWFGIGNIQTNDKSVIAPIGEGGATANIPTGSIAFRINETTAKGSSIYVIVSVPVSHFYDGSSPESLNTQMDYYLGLWQTQDIDDDSFSYNTFSQTSAVQKFELPRSRPYGLDSTAANSDYILVEHGGTTYRCYLNGERVLVAYCFTVMEAGTYILGTAIGDSGFFNTYKYDYPMEIVYCAADGTASEGRDGTSGSVFGALDYVYDNNGTIVHVQDYATAPETTPETKYNYYYNSHIITYTDNETSVINQLQLWPRRYIDGGTIKLQIYSSDPTLFKGKHAGVDTDVVVTGTPPTGDGGS